MTRLSPMHQPPGALTIDRAINELRASPAAVAEAIRDAHCICISEFEIAGLCWNSESICCFHINSQWVEAGDDVPRSFWKHTADMKAVIIGTVVFDSALCDRLLGDGARAALEDDAATHYQMPGCKDAAE